MANRAHFIASELKRIDGVTPGNGAVKHKKMATHPFLFLRGAAQVFFADLAKQNLRLPTPLETLPNTTIMGDCHTSNFGFLTEEGSHGDSVVFAPNDFDDACIGNPAWDLLRFCVSLKLCADYCQFACKNNDELKGKMAVDDAHVDAAIDAFLISYLAICESALTGRDHFSSAVESVQLDTKLAKLQSKAQRRAAGGLDFSSKSALAKAIDSQYIPPCFNKDSDKFVALSQKDYAALKDMFSPYMDDKVLDIVKRINAGTGSINIERYYFLVGPEKYHSTEDLALCHIVEVKQQRQASALHHFADIHPANNLNPAHLTVMCQRRMQRRPDLVVDEAEWRNRHWLIRSRHHAKIGIDPEDIGIGKKNVMEGGFSYYAQCCGTALALAHCRGDRRSIRLEQAISVVLPDSMVPLKLSALNYAKQVKKDCAWLASQEAGLKARLKG